MAPPSNGLRVPPAPCPCRRRTRTGGEARPDPRVLTDRERGASLTLERTARLELASRGWRPRVQPLYHARTTNFLPPTGSYRASPARGAPRRDGNHVGAPCRTRTSLRGFVVHAPPPEDGATWSVRRDSNPCLEDGNLACCRLHHARSAIVLAGPARVELAARRFGDGCDASASGLHSRLSKSLGRPTGSAPASFRVHSPAPLLLGHGRHTPRRRHTRPARPTIWGLASVPTRPRRRYKGQLRDGARGSRPLELAAGLEPATSALPKRRSARRTSPANWSWWRDSNPHIPGTNRAVCLRTSTSGRSGGASGIRTRGLLRDGQPGTARLPYGTVVLVAGAGFEPARRSLMRRGPSRLATLQWLRAVESHHAGLGYEPSALHRRACPRQMVRNCCGWWVPVARACLLVCSAREPSSPLSGCGRD